MPYFEHNELLFHYIQTAQGKPFIFQHGLGGSVDQIIKIYSPPAGVKLVSCDFRAHGKTATGWSDQLNFNTFADDIVALMDHLHLDQAIVGGISMGAAVALNFVLRYPALASGLILVRPAWLDGPMEKNSTKYSSSLHNWYGSTDLKPVVNYLCMLISIFNYLRSPQVLPSHSLDNLMMKD